jgi:diguanylate cyclase (GGDEF)-like protein
VPETIRVLYIEDEADIRELAELALEDEGFVLVSCASGPDALARAPGLTPDLILVDVMMPGMDGPTTVRGLRELPHLSATPVIFMTAKVQPSEIADYLELGALGVIAKPFEAMTLGADLRKLLSGRDAAVPAGRAIAGLEELHTVFASSLPGRLAALREAFEAVKQGSPGEFPIHAPLRRLVHNLAGAAGTFGFERLGRRARELELRLVKPDVRIPFPPEVESALEESLAELGRLAAKGSDTERSGRTIPDPLPDGLAAGSDLVYVVEDDELLAREIAHQLRHFNYTVEAFPSSLELSAAYSRMVPAALVADVVLPEGELEGPRIAAELQSSAARQVPVVYVSVRDDWGAQVAAIRAGGRAYLPKPLDFGSLVEQLDRLTGRAPEPPLRVVIVEDEPLLAEEYSGILRRAGMEVEVVLEPSSLLDRLSAFAPDLLLLDIYLPGCTGAEVAQIVRQNPAYTMLPIVYLSTEQSREEQLLALGKGGDDFLEKPIDPAHLIAAIGIRAKRFRDLSSLASRDGLTGLLTHLSVKQALERELARSHRNQGTLSLAMVDLDGFKLLNDRFGHPVGDRVLRSLARLFSHRLRKGDLAGRYGGEEFTIVLPDTSLAAARALLDELRESFAAIRFVQGTEPFHVAFSAGIAAAPPHTEIDELIRAADQALYAAKRAGRNRVMLDQAG